MSAPNTENGAPEFDAYSKNYNEEINKALSFSGLKIDFFARVKNDYLIDILHKRPGEVGGSVLDVGCGIGNAHKHLIQHIGNLVGVDVSAASIAIARRKNPDIQYHVFDGVHLPFADKMFSFAFAINVFHHVPVTCRSLLVQEVRRVLCPGAMFAIFEHNPVNPVTSYVVNSCEFDKDAVLLKRRETEQLLSTAGFHDIYSRYIIAIPAAGSLLRRIDRCFSLLPLGAQYYTLGTLR